MIQQKAAINGEELCAQMPPPLLSCHNCVKSLQPAEMSRNSFINDCIKRCIPLNARPNDPHDWEITNAI
ncbi:unnamed protein product [Brugia pahangi]|uniref:Zf-Tim10_DDP domain-containing protein n=1 Tax=Brugia pahangi TaxID=6280 RepID=A0A0N4TZV1_BRUPA|nr:unnamed protein product [Brugia pahangi]